METPDSGFGFAAVVCQYILSSFIVCNARDSLVLTALLARTSLPQEDVNTHVDCAVDMASLGIPDQVWASNQTNDDIGSFILLSGCASTSSALDCSLASTRNQLVKSQPEGVTS